MPTAQKASSFREAPSAFPVNGSAAKSILVLAFFVASGIGLLTFVDRLYFPATAGAVLEVQLKEIGSDVKRIETKVDELLREQHRGAGKKGSSDGD